MTDEARLDQIADTCRKHLQDSCTEEEAKPGLRATLAAIKPLKSLMGDTPNQDSWTREAVCVMARAIINAWDGASNPADHV